MSRPVRRDAFLRAPSVTRELSAQRKSSPKRQKRQANVYDAVAGHVTSNGFLPGIPLPSKNRDTLSSSTLPVPPEEVLFRRRGAPERYQEDDIYWADRHLSSGQILPESDLLKAIHVYASDFYNRTTEDKGQGDFRSMDETALLAMGILLEETVKRSLGDTGDMVFVEGETEGDLASLGVAYGGSSSKGVKSRSRSNSQVEPKLDDDRRTKRRKLLSGEDTEAI